MVHFHHVTPIQRKDRDSNPGTPKGVNGFRDRPVRPLRHLSNGRFVICGCKVSTFFFKWANFTAKNFYKLYNVSIALRGSWALKT